MTITWHGKWHPVENDRHRQYIERELEWELSHFPQHPLSRVPFCVVAALDTYDNFIIRLTDDGRYAYVHLTWTQESPSFELIGNDEALNRFVQTLSQVRGEDLADLDPDAQAAIQEGLAQADRGETRAWEDVRKELRARFINKR